MLPFWVGLENNSAQKFKETICGQYPVKDNFSIDCFFRTSQFSKSIISLETDSYQRHIQQKLQYDSGENKENPICLTRHRTWI